MMAAIVAFTNCQPKDIELPEVAPAISNFRIELGLPDTKTANVNDGSRFGTNWAENDAVGIFCRPSAGGEFVALGKFTLTAGAGTPTGQFEPEDYQPLLALNEETKFDWYALYPYSSKVTTPASTDASGGYMYVGRSDGLNQTGYDSSAALYGSQCPLYAKVLGVSVNDFNGNSIPVKNLTSVIEFTVVNGTGKDLVVNSMTVEASEPIVGSFYIDVTGDKPEYNYEAASTYVHKTAKVNINNADVIPSGGSVKVYLPIKPYYQSGKEEFKVNVTGTVNGDAFAKEFSAIPDQDKSYFEAGKFKKISLTVPPIQVSTSNTVADALAADGAYKIEGATVTMVYSKGVFVKDNTGTICVYLNAAPTVEKGDVVTVNGTTSVRNNFNLRQFGAGTTLVKTGTASTPSPTSWTGTNVTAAYEPASGSNAAYVKVTATASDNYGSNKSLVVEGTEVVLYVSGQASGVSISKNKSYELVGYAYDWSLYNNVKEVAFYVESATEVGGGVEASLTISPTSLSFEVDGGSKDVTVTSDNANWTVSEDIAWITVSKSSGAVTVTAEANSGENKREGEIVFTHSNGSLTKTLKVSQKGTSPEDILNLSAASISFGSTDSESKKITVTCNSSEWSVDTSTVPAWLTVQEYRETNPDSGKTEEYFTVKAANNTDTEPRNATIVVKHPNGELSRNLAVGQNGASTSGSKTYSLVSSVSAMTSGEYLVVYVPDSGDSYAMNGGLSTLDAAGNRVKVTISGNTISYSGDDVYFTYDASEGSFKGAGGKYLAHTGSSNKINSVSKYSEDSCKMTVSFDGSDASIMAASGYWLRFNFADGQNRFRYYNPSSTSTTLAPVRLYKKN